MSGSGGGPGKGVPTSELLKAAATAFTAAAVGGVAVYTLLQAIDTKKVSGFVSDLLGTSSRSRDEAKSDVEGNSLHVMAEKDRGRGGSDDGLSSWDDDSHSLSPHRARGADSEQRRKAEAEAEIERISFNALIAFDPDSERREIESEFRRIQMLTAPNQPIAPATAASASSSSTSASQSAGSSTDLFLPGFHRLPSILAQHIFHFLTFDSVVLLSPVCRRWWLFLRLVKRNRTFLRIMALRGFPNHCRAKFWELAASADMVVKRMLKQYPLGNPTLYQRLLQQEPKGRTQKHLDAIAKDVGRTFTHHDAFYTWNEKENRSDEKVNNANESDEQKKLRTEIENEADETLSRILTAYAIHDPQLGYCFTSQHQLLTSKGFVFVDEINDGDLVASYSADNNTFKFVPCSTVKKDGRHTLYTLKSQRTTEHMSDNIEVTVTADHDMWVQKEIASEVKDRWSKVKAHELSQYFSQDKKAQVRVLVGAKNGIADSDIDVMQLELVKALSLNNSKEVDAFLQLYGYWLSNTATATATVTATATATATETETGINEDCSISSSSVVFACKKKDDLEWVGALLLSVLKEGDDYVCAPSRNGVVEYRVNNPRWVRYFSSEYGDAEKPIDAKRCWSWYRLLGAHHCRQIIQGLIFANGGGGPSVHEDSSAMINTSSTLFRDEVIDLAIRAGFVADFSMESPECAIDQSAPNWTISLSDKHERILKGGDEEESSYTGAVHCVSVGGDGLIIARKVFKCETIKDRNGNLSKHVTAASKPLVIGNCAPEVITRKPYSKLVDNWTLGVLMFILLSGYHPFDVYGDLPEADLLKRIVANSYDFDDPVWEHITDDAKSLIKRLLQIDPSKRMSLEDYLEQPWVGGRAKDVPLPHVVDRLSKFNVGRQKFRALVLAKLASAKFKASISKSAGRGGGSGTWNFAAALAAATSSGTAPFNNANGAESLLDSGRRGMDRDMETASRRGSAGRGQLLLPPQPGPAASTLHIPHSAAERERHLHEERQDSNGYQMHSDSPPQSRPISVVGINMEAGIAAASSSVTPIVSARVIGDHSPNMPNSITRDDVKVELSYKDAAGLSTLPREKDKDTRASSSQHRTVFVNAAGTSAHNSANPSPRQTTP